MAARDATKDAAKEAAKGAAFGAGVGGLLWGMAVPAVNFMGFGAGGIGAGTWAASMMSSAAVANGGGVAAGSAVAVMQGVGAAGLAATTGPAIVVTGMAVGGIALGAKYLAKRQGDGEEGTDDGDDGGDSGTSDTSKAEKKEAPKEETDTGKSENSSWVLFEWSSAAVDPVETRFNSEREAREAYASSSSTKKKLCRSDVTVVERTPDCRL